MSEKGPKPVTPVVGRGGTNDDGVKPAPAPLPLPAAGRGGVIDDGVRPAAPQKAPPPKP
ncbi:MAG: hypothetical protein JST00_45245 [Deltaproteobacteria bacterium]|nr:hypothetical protein [Deltaproteobacteria bacterium]